MNKLINIFSGDGLGGQLLSFNVADLLKKKGYLVNINACCRDEIFRVLKCLLPNQSLNQYPDYYAEKMVVDDDFFNDVVDSNSNALNYVVFPDLLYGKRGFDWKKFNLHPQVIRQNRLLLNEWKPENIVYVGLNTSTEFYRYSYTHELLEQLALQNPHYVIYFADIKKWAGIDIKNNIRKDLLPDNCLVDDNPDFIDSLKVLQKSSYCVCLDTVLFHMEFHVFY